MVATWTGAHFAMIQAASPTSKVRVVTVDLVVQAASWAVRGVGLDFAGTASMALTAPSWCTALTRSWRFWRRRTRRSQMWYASRRLPESQSASPGLPPLGKLPESSTPLRIPYQTGSRAFMSSERRGLLGIELQDQDIEHAHLERSMLAAIAETALSVTAWLLLSDNQKDIIVQVTTRSQTTIARFVINPNHQRVEVNAPVAGAKIMTRGVAAGFTAARDSFTELMAKRHEESLRKCEAKQARKQLREEIKCMRRKNLLNGGEDSKPRMRSSNGAIERFSARRLPGILRKEEKTQKERMKRVKRMVKDAKSPERSPLVILSRVQSQHPPPHRSHCVICLHLR
ncbi:hypothetical protein K437DRAFT_122709 [Tilletiaria anomala UBC 951]|uniref:Uncharacterized protein n=1 Tax=Tilletiaria anomala (strain ATCC 24038 / CBS 436.72 / UBC 951) TaxID=1037660 RepID=A0A066VUX6_TILAU|nr:uncharacterized protein K437DRAFT_122709 [Tilletiaria anomala UBC 951]KDN45281.1 hypothetical protein K437DRAFT_122709 [Tilletiaria anomala UBC 951]